MNFRHTNVLVFLSLLFMSCGKEVELPKTLEIRSQTDLDVYCEKLLETVAYNGTIIIGEEAEDVDLSCFQNIKSVSSSLVLEGYNAVNAFKNIETVGFEGLAIGGTITQAISFEKLVSASAITILSNAALNEVQFPNVEDLVSFKIASSVDIEKVTGLHKVKTILQIIMANGDDSIGEIDVFRNLENITLFSIALPTETQLSSESFDALSTVILDSSFKKNGLGYSLEDLFPLLKSSNNLYIDSADFELTDFCYLKPFLESKDIDIIFRPSIVFGDPIFPFTNDEILEACQ
ncbi:MAG: hypothetical protein P1U56_17265 [Saprospiraceae bacterium]|nr:hypothetical protein [Saprospiraceae bacterium]